MNYWLLKFPAGFQKKIEMEAIFSRLGETKAKSSFSQHAATQRILPNNIGRELLKLINENKTRDINIGAEIMRKYDFNQLRFQEPQLEYPRFLYFSIVRFLQGFGLTSAIFSDEQITRMLNVDYDWNQNHIYLNKHQLIKSLKKLNADEIFFNFLSPNHQFIFLDNK